MSERQILIDGLEIAVEALAGLAGRPDMAVAVPTPRHVRLTTGSLLLAKTAVEMALRAAEKMDEPIDLTTDPDDAPTSPETPEAKTLPPPPEPTPIDVMRGDGKHRRPRAPRIAKQEPDDSRSDPRDAS